MNNFLKKISFGLFGGLKDADNLLTSNNHSNDSNSISVNQKVEHEKLSKDLLKGEETEIVKELRYRLYKDSEESRKYSYLGNGVAIKNEDSIHVDYENSENYELILIQPNYELPNSLYEDIENLNKFQEKKYILNIKREFVPRYKIEEFTNKIVVKKIDDTHSQLDLYCTIYPNVDNFKSKGFISEIKKIKEEGIKSDITDFDGIKFITNKCYKQEELIQFEYDNIYLKEIVEYGGSYVLKFKSHNTCEPIDLKKKFFSKEMSDKYEKNEKKDVIFNLSEIDKKEYVCSECGKKITNEDFLKSGDNLEFYDAQITLETYGRVICKDCLEKLINEEKINI